MPYKDREQQLKYMRDYQQRRKLKGERREYLDEVGGILADLYLKQLAAIPKDAKVVDGTSLLQGEILGMSYKFQRVVGKHEHHFAVVFAEGILGLTQPYGKRTWSKLATESMVEWVRAFDQLIKRHTKANESWMQEKYLAMDPKWKSYIEKMLPGRSWK